MASNYPPGVTGSEPEIVGTDEDTLDTSCVCGYDGPMPADPGRRSWLVTCPRCEQEFDVEFNDV